MESHPPPSPPLFGFAPCPVQATPELIVQALQLHDMLHIRTGLLLLGPTACGKSAVRSVLQLALSRLDVAAGGSPVTSTDIFPKVHECLAKTIVCLRTCVHLMGMLANGGGVTWHSV